MADDAEDANLDANTVASLDNLNPLYPNKNTSELQPVEIDLSSISRKIIEYIKKFAESKDELDKYNLPSSVNITHTFEFGYRGKGKQFFYTKGYLSLADSFVKVPLVGVPKCTDIIYVRVVITNLETGEPPMVHVDLKEKLVVLGFALMRRQAEEDPPRTLVYSITAFGEPSPSCSERKLNDIPRRN